MQLPIVLLTDVVDVWHVEFSELCLAFAHALFLEEALQAESFLSWIASLDCLCVACASVVQSPIGDYSQAQPEQTWHLSFISTQHAGSSNHHCGGHWVLQCWQSLCIHCTT